MVKWAKSKRENPDFFDGQESLEPLAVSDSLYDPQDSPQEKHPAIKAGPHWEVEDAGPSDFVQKFFKPA